MATFRTNDNATIHYEVYGKGNPKTLLMIHGWDQSAAAFCENVPTLAEHYQVVTIDLRGHGDSENVKYGYRISRLAMDVHELIELLGLQDITILGWSMGCSVTWSYWDLFRDEHLAKMVLVDEPPLCLINEGNPVGFTDNDGLNELVDSVLNDTVNATQGFVDMMLYTEEGKEKWGEQTLEESLKMPKEQCAFLVRNHVYTDWRDVIPTISIPTLVIAAEHSHVPVANNEWTHEQIAGSEFICLKDAHMTFLTDPEPFNRALIEFIG